ncbi:MAG: hypothetical protein U1E78_01805 [Gammaproteobacteria bacterium]
MQDLKYLTALGLVTLSLNATGISSTELFPDHQNTLVLNGVEVRKGTIASLIFNVETLDKALSNQDPDLAQIHQAVKDIQSVLVGLDALEIFELFPIEQWLNATTADGQPRYSKHLVGLMALQHFPKYQNRNNNQLSEEARKTLPIILLKYLKKED